MTVAYSPAKAGWHTDRIDALRQGKPIVPVHVQLIISDLCNQNCHFCAYRMDGGFSTEQFALNGAKNPNRKIPTAKCKEIIDDCAAAGVKAIQFTGGGEPTVHPDCAEIIAHAQDRGLDTALVTNGTRLPPVEVLNRLSWVRLSLDAGTPATYERVRQSKLWPKAMDGLKALGSLDGPLTGVGFVITRENWREIGLASVIAKDSGVSNIRLAAMFSEEGSGHYAGLTHEIERLIQTAKANCDGEGFEVVDMFSHRLGDLDQGQPEDSFCGYQQFTVYIGGDQKVYRCCTTSYTKHGEIGDLSGMRFRDWLGGDHYAGFDARSCHHCQFNQQNRAINYLLSPEQQHVNFV